MNENEYKQTKDNELHQRYITHIGQLEVRVNELNAKIHNLESQLTDQDNIKQQIKKLYTSVDNKILNTLERRGNKRRSQRKNALYSLSEMNARQQNNVGVILQEIRKNDIASYFRYHSPITTKKIHYRIIGKAYRTTRSLLLKTVKSSIKVTRKVKGARK